MDAKMDELPNPTRWELERDYIMRLREHGLSMFKAKEHSRKMFLLGDISNATDISDLKEILKRIVTGE
jgi:hypothetical protein